MKASVEAVGACKATGGDGGEGYPGTAAFLTPDAVVRAACCCWRRSRSTMLATIETALGVAGAVFAAHCTTRSQPCWLQVRAAMALAAGRAAVVEHPALLGRLERARLGIYCATTAPNISMNIIMACELSHSICVVPLDLNRLMESFALLCRRPAAAVGRDARPRSDGGPALASRGNG